MMFDNIGTHNQVALYDIEVCMSCGKANSWGLIVPTERMPICDDCQLRRGVYPVSVAGFGRDDFVDAGAWREVGELFAGEEIVSMMSSPALNQYVAFVGTRRAYAVFAMDFCVGVISFPSDSIRYGRLQQMPLRSWFSMVGVDAAPASIREMNQRYFQPDYSDERYFGAYLRVGLSENFVLNCFVPWESPGQETFELRFSAGTM